MTAGRPEQQRHVMPRPCKQVALSCFLIINLTFLGQTLGVGALTLYRDGNNPDDERVTVIEGETLTMECSVTVYANHIVWWGKVNRSGTYYMTRNLQVYSGFPRVSLSGFLRSHYTYSIRITNVELSDERFICYARWNGGNDRWGYVNVVVTAKSFPQEDPICSSNEAVVSSIHDVAVRCETERGNPRVTITWTIETGVEVGGNASNYTDAEARIGSSFDLEPQQLDKLIICTVTSSAFPGRSRTCSIGPIVEFISTTEKIDPTTTPVETTHASSTLLITTATDEIHTSNLPSEITSKSAGIGDVGTISAGAVIAVLVLVVFLLCILKRRRQTGDDETGKQGRETASVKHGLGAAEKADVHVLYSVVQKRNNGTGASEASDPACGGKANNSPYEVELDPASGYASYSEVPETDDVGSNSCAIYEIIDQDDSDSESVTCHENDSRNSNDKQSSGAQGTSNIDIVALPGDIGRLGVIRSVIDDEGMVENPIYEPYDGN